jgi:hypothetical protein
MNREIVPTVEAASTSPGYDAGDFLVPATSDVAPLRRGQFVDSLEEKLEASQLRTEQGKFFIPRGTLENILDQDTICLAIQDSLPDLDPIEAASYASVIRGQGCFPLNEKSFCKIFAILLLSDMVESIRDIVRLGLDDSYLPMPDPRLSDSKLEVSSGSQHTVEEDVIERPELWEDLWNLWGRFRQRIFFMSQWAVIAPVFHSVDRVNHFSFSQNYVLPFPKKESPTPSNSNSALDSRNLDQARYGGYSEVRQIKIHPDHYNFGHYGVSKSRNFPRI